MSKLHFEKLNSDFPIYRARVPGGWFVICVSANKTMPIAMASGGTFVPDPMHTWDGADFNFDESIAETENANEPTVTVFNTKTAIDFAMECGAKYRGRSHAFNSLKKLKRELFVTGVNTQDPSVLAQKWYEYVLKIKGGKKDTRYSPEEFTKDVAVL